MSKESRDIGFEKKQKIHQGGVKNARWKFCKSDELSEATMTDEEENSS